METHFPEALYMPDNEDILKAQNFILSAKDLVAHHAMVTLVPPRGVKETHPDGSAQQDQQIKRRQDQRQSLLMIQRVAKLGNLSVGEWEPDKELVVVKSHKGKFWHTMGYMLQGQKYLYPEEGLFLLEVGSMELQYGGVPLSIQRAYSLLIPTYLSKEHYRVYCHLIRLGYIVTRHRECDITDYEYRLRMHQYRHTQNLAYHKVQGWFKQLGDEPMNSLWPDSDSTSGSLPSFSPQTGRKRSRMFATHSNANTHSSNGREQSGCDSSEVGSAGEMSRMVKARQKLHKTEAKAKTRDSEMVISKKNLQAYLKQRSKSLQDGEESQDSTNFDKFQKGLNDVNMTGSDHSGESAKKPDDAVPLVKGEKTGDFVEPMEPSDMSAKNAKLLKEASDDSSIYSDGPVYPEDVDAGKSANFEETSISLLDFHKRRLTGSSEDGSNKPKKWKRGGSESDSSRGSMKRSISSHLAVSKPTLMRACDKRTLDDSGKDTHSDLDQESPKHDQQFRPVKTNFRQGQKSDLKRGKKPKERSLSSDLGLSDTASSNSVDLEEFLDMVVPIMHGVQEAPAASEQRLQSYLEYPHWNFDKIALPDIASCMMPHRLPFPAKELLPKSIAASRSINDLNTVEDNQAQLTELCNNNKMLLAKSKKIISVLEHIGDEKDKPGGGGGDSKQPSTQTSKEPDNWKEYKEKQQQAEQNMGELLTSPVSHLWTGDVKPLLKPSDAKSTSHVLNKLQVIHGANLTSEHSGQRFSPPLVDSKIAFDVFLPDKKYKKTSPGQPNLCVVVCSEEDSVPELAIQLDLLLKAAPVPVVWGVVDNTDISFYTLTDIELPVDIALG